MLTKKFDTFFKKGGKFRVGAIPRLPLFVQSTVTKQYNFTYTNE